MKIEPSDGKVSLSISGSYTAQELDDLIQVIGEARAKIANDPDSPVGLPVAITNAGWYTEFNSLANVHALLILTQLGWQGTALSTADAAKLAGLLATQVSAAVASTAATVAQHNDDGSNPAAVH